MNDKGKIIIGLALFLIIITFPVWYNIAGGVEPMEEIEIATAGVAGRDRCVESAEYMKPYHMDLLNKWREKVVRDGDRIHTTDDGRKFEMSLSNTCMDCHYNKESFCDRCHNFMAVDPYCWDCHIEPKELER